MLKTDKTKKYFKGIVQLTFKQYGIALHFWGKDKVTWYEITETLLKIKRQKHEL